MSDTNAAANLNDAALDMLIERARQAEIDVRVATAQRDMLNEMIAALRAPKRRPRMPRIEPAAGPQPIPPSTSPIVAPPPRFSLVVGVAGDPPDPPTDRF